MRGAMYLGYLAQGTLLRPERNSRFCRAILSYYADMFQYGVDSLSSATTDKQQMMLRYHLGQDCVVEGAGIVLPVFIMNVWEIYTLLFDKLTVRFISIEPLDPDATSVALIQEVSMVSTHRSIYFLMPHMLQNYEFMQHAPGKLLKLRLQYQVRFNDQNRIVYVNIEHQMAKAWLQVLESSRLVTAACSRMQPVTSTFISANYKQLLNDRQFMRKDLIS